MTFDKYPSISLDYALIEKAENVAMVEMECDWTDLGSWDAVYEINKKVKHVLNVNRPDGYLTVREFSEREEMPRHIIYYFINYKKLKSTFVKGHWYVLGTETMKGVKIRDYKMSSNKL